MSQNLSQVQTNLRDNYSTTATMNATIQAKIDGLSSTISQTYATGSDVQQKLASADATAKGYADAAKQEAVDTAQASTKELLKSYATVTKTQSMIDQKATSIESTVSSTYATKDSVGELQTWKTEASQKITDSAIISTITSSTEWTKKADANTVSKLETRVEQTETDITSKVSKSSISSEINQTAQDVKISASKINFNGLVTANNYFKINKNGSMEAISGKIGGWTIGSNTLKSVDSKITLDAKNGKITTAQDNSGRVTTITPGNVSTGHIAAYIVIHETDNWSKGADAKAHATAMKNGNLAGTVHYYVDSKSIYQTLEHSDGAWAVGDGKGKYGITNRNSINIEICVNPETDYYKAVDKAEQLAAQLLKQYGWGTDRLKRHYDVSRKNCPRRIQAEGRWPEFVKKTAAYMKGATTVKNTTTKNTVTLSDKIEVQFPVIQKGSKGTAVSMLQAVLGVKVDGDFGNDTETSLKAFQKNVKLTADGICGKDTWTKVIEHMKANT